MRPVVTVGLCVKNAEKTLGETLESILKQDYRRDLTEIVIVYGSSQDKTLPIVKQMMSKARVRWSLYSDEDRGLGYARQSVVNHAEGRFIVFVDSDVIIRKDFFRRQVEFMNRHPAVGIGLGRYMYKDGNWLMSAWNLYHYIVQNFVGCAFICRTDTIVSAGGFDEKIKGAGEDVELVARITASGWSCTMSEGAEFYHNYRATLLAFLMEHRWFGYGWYYLSRKSPRLFNPYRNVPPGRLIQGMKVASRAYRSSRRNISFLIPFLLVLANLAWWSGFLQATIQGDYSS